MTSRRGPSAGVTTAVWSWALASRALVWAGALGAIAVIGRRTATMVRFDPDRLTRPFHAAWANLAVSPAARWDSVWYLHIAQSGYFSRQSTAFFPLYPLLLSVAGNLGAELILGIVISVLATAVGLYLLLALTRLELGERAARTTVLLVVLFPTALFLSSVYTEGLFLALSVGAIYAARLDRWALASVLGALAGAARPNGILIALPLILIYLYGPRAADARAERGWRPRYRLERSALWLLLVPAGLFAYLGYVWLTRGSPLEPFAVEHLWQRSFAGPFGAVAKLASVLPHDVHLLVTHRLRLGDYAAHDFIDLVFLVFALLGLVLAFRRLPFALSAYAFVFLAQTLSEPFAPEPLASFSRYLLGIFPLFMAWGAWLSERRRVRTLALALSAVLLVAFSGLWGIWEWVA